MRILFDQGVYDLRNKGNVALLQVAVDRIRRLWPAATLEVLTSAPHVLRLYCPAARAVSPDAPGPPSFSSGAVHRLLDVIPVPVLRLLLEMREASWYRGAAFKTEAGAASADPPVAGAGGSAAAPRATALEPLEGADLVVATGAQYMADACKDDALHVLDRLEAASRRGVPTAMVGQGVGPFDDPELRSRARQVLPLVDLILVRDRPVGPALLQSLGVGASNIVFTGDDAIEPAYLERTHRPGRQIGVSVRLSHYTQVADRHVEVVRQVLQAARERYRTKLVPIPISYSTHERDEHALRRVVGDGSRRPHVRPRFRSPRAVIRTVARCRIVVTGAFHTAVFALAQGIPAVGLARTRMYRDKFAGLADQFGAGCAVIDLEAEGAQPALARAIDAAWGSAEELRPGLLEAAERQIALGHAAYRRLYDLVEDRRRAVGT